MKKCAYCGAEFKPYRDHQKYCSPKCKDKSNYRKNREKNLAYAKAYQAEHRGEILVKKMKCAYCGAEFKPYRDYQKYCCRKCKSASNYRKNHEKNLAYAKAYQVEHREELRIKHKIYSITGKWPKGKLT